jgi:hypothetical protein
MVTSKCYMQACGPKPVPAIPYCIDLIGGPRLDVKPESSMSLDRQADDLSRL